jgi:hypothetical protein
LADPNDRSCDVIDTRRAIDDGDSVVARHFGQLFVKRGFGHADDRTERFIALCRPFAGAALGISIDEQNLQALVRKCRCEIDAERCFANAAFLIE